MTKSLRLTLAAFALIAFGGIALGQSGFWSNWPIVGGASYSCGSVNGVSNCTVAAGPTTITGNENIPGNTNLSGGRTPQNVLFSMASLNANPISVVTVTGTNPANISASNLSGGVIYNASGTITSASITLPLSPADKQQYAVNANRNITTLFVGAPAGTTMAANTAPTVLTASTVGGSQGYRFMYDVASTSWFRLQ